MPDGSSMTRYVSGTAIIKLRAVPQAARHPTAIREAVGFRLLTIYVTDFESVLGRWKATGAAEPRPIPAPKGAQAALLADPDGNPIELVGMPDDNMAGLDKMAIGLTVSNVEKSREFYGKVLGLQESRPATPASPNGATEYRFMAGKTQIAFWPGLSANLPAHTGNITEALGFRYFTFMVKDLDATAAALKARGAKIVMEPRDFGAIALIMMVSDPDGNWIEFAALKSGR
jgi:predicted enzyme related to lactoylglutathione lyase